MTHRTSAVVMVVVSAMAANAGFEPKELNGRDPVKLRGCAGENHGKGAGMADLDPHRRCRRRSRGLGSS